MKLTKKLIESIFDECNKVYFGNSVRKPQKITITHHPNHCGMTYMKRSKDKSIKMVGLHISDRFQWTEQWLKNVIIHEMIHLKLYETQKPLNFLTRLFYNPHGKEFKQMMNELNDRFGLNITITFPYITKIEAI